MAMGVEVRSRGGKGKRNRKHPEMNVTPLVDVVLVLLIIFMVITPMMHDHFWVHVPSAQRNQEAAEPQPEDLGPIVVSVNAQGEIQVNRDVYSDAEFPIRLRRMLVARGERKVFFDAHDDAPFDRAMRALDLARGGGAAHIAILTESVAAP